MNRTNKGFTLVEILIVVIILGILAAIVIPQFTNASQDARTSSLQSDLQTLRSQVELYKFQHLDKYPWQKPTDGTADTAANFWLRMTTKTDSAGAAGGNFGPYVQSRPTNPFVAGTDGQDVDISDTTGAASTKGWFIDTTLSKVSPGDADHRSY